MLAQLERIDGVNTAEVDHRGQLLRLDAANEQAVADVIVTLSELGYGADELGGVPDIERWYGRDSVHELSREEGHIIAERVVHPFSRARGMDPIAAERLESVVARALGAHFAAHSIDPTSPGASIREESVSAVREAAAALIGPDAAGDFAVALRQDLDSVDGPSPPRD